MTTVIALLRAVNVGGRTVHAATLREVAAACGYLDPVTYAASGNLVLETDETDPVGTTDRANTTAEPEPTSTEPGAGTKRGLTTTDRVAQTLTTALTDRFGFIIPVVARTLDEWRGLIAGLPYPEQAAADPSRLFAYLWDGPTAPDAAAAIERYASPGDLHTWAPQHTYLYLPGGAAATKLTITVMSRAAGRLGTARNWRTVMALAELAGRRATSPTDHS